MSILFTLFRSLLRRHRSDWAQVGKQVANNISLHRAYRWPTARLHSRYYEDLNGAEYAIVSCCQDEHGREFSVDNSY